MTVACDVGAHQIWTARYFLRFEPRHLLFSMGHQTMGVGLPWAIGAALARPGKPAISISGDGSFLMTCMELETAVRLKLPTVHLVWCDGSFNLVGLLALREYGREVGTHFGPTDFVTLAQSIGAGGFRVNHADEFGPRSSEPSPCARRPLLRSRSTTAKTYPWCSRCACAVD